MRVASIYSEGALTAAPRDRLADAAVRMTVHRVGSDVGIRHLPVVHDGALLGTVSARDLLILEAWPQVDSDHHSVPDTAPIGHIERSRETA